MSKSEDQSRLSETSTDLFSYSDLVNATGPFPQSCVNDGLQFYMGLLSGAGRYNQNYDTALHNTYTLTNETFDIDHYTVVIAATGSNLDQVIIDVYRTYNRQPESLASKTGTLAVGDTLSITNFRLHLPLNVTRTSCRYDFNYGDPQTDGLRWFAFNNEDAGYEAHPLASAARPPGQYCFTTINVQGGPGKTTECTFPAW
jgi:hypothetical protein